MSYISDLFNTTFVRLIIKMLINNVPINIRRSEANLISVIYLTLNDIVSALHTTEFNSNKHDKILNISKVILDHRFNFSNDIYWHIMDVVAIFLCKVSNGQLHL